MMTDPIADMLTRLRNAIMAHKSEVVMPFSKLKMNILSLLQKEGYLSNVEKIEDGKFPELKVTIKYNDARESAINSIKRVSKPGQKIYAKHTELPVVLNNYGIAIISTSKGLMTNVEAKKQGLGGEVVCEVY
jgi:small subunit ribosomal protein S8